jgi:hypothetical protein
MKLPQHIFALTRGEQRVVIIIMIGLLLGAVGKRYYDGRTHPAASPSSHAAPSPPSTGEESAATAEEGAPY